VLLILDVYPLRRFEHGPGRWFAPAARNIWLEKLPFLALSLVFLILAISARRQSLDSVERNDASSSVAQACYGIWFYIIKTAVPLNLIAVYPAPKTIDWLAPEFLLSILSTMAMTAGLFLVRRRWPGLLAAWLSYLVILSPNSGLIRISDQIAADRYSYISMLGLVIVLAGALCRLWPTSAWARPNAMAMIAVGIGLMILLMFMSREQCRTWRDSERLWTYALHRGGAESSLAHFNLALVLYRQGKFGEAVAHDTLALRLNPGDSVVHNNLGVVLQRQGKLEAAGARYADALRLNPNYIDAHYNLGIVLSQQGKFKEAADHYGEVLRLDPGFADAHHNLGVDLFREGKLAEAAWHYTEALRRNPNRVDTHNNLGVVLARQGKFELAAAHYAEALRLDPGYADAQKNLETDRTRQRTNPEAKAQ
jgi:Flp pilus assembly protein TadD